MTKIIEPKSLEHGVNFITLYFTTINEANEYAERAYNRFRDIKFYDFDINRRNFMHLPGDPDHFHSDGPAINYWPGAFRHFHIIYSHKPNQDDWDYLYKHLNDPARKLKLRKGLPIREVRVLNGE